VKGIFHIDSKFFEVNEIFSFIKLDFDLLAQKFEIKIIANAIF